MNPSRLIAVGILIASGGCASTAEKAADERRQLSNNLCKNNIARSTPYIMVSYINATGAKIDGNVTAQNIVQRKSWPSVLAATRKPVTTVTSRGVCTVPRWINPYQFVMINVPCIEEDDKSLASIFGVGRAADLSEAEKIAIGNCESVRDDFSAKTGIRASKRDLECVVVSRQECNF
jgi:hypothetical protein